MKGTCLNNWKLKSNLSSCLFRIINTSYFMHIHVMIYFFFIHLFIFVLLHYLEMCIFIVSCPVRCLNFSNPFLTACLKLWPLDLIFTFLHPEIDIWKIIWLKSSVHMFHTVPWNKSTASQTFTSIYFKNLPGNLWSSKWS